MTVRLVDSHCHLQVDDLRSRAEELLNEARQAGVIDLLIPGIRPTEATSDHALAESLGVWCAIGCHPCHADEWDEAALLGALDLPRVVAVGECGLDRFHKPFDADLQDRVFRRQIAIAREAGLPLVLHNRETDRELVRVLREERAAGGVFHCFGGDERCLEEALELGFFVSFAGNVTYPKAAFRSLVPRVPRERLLVETDAPWLAPVPDRGRTCRPAHAATTLRELATLRGEDAASLGEAVVDNFRLCFPRTAGIAA